MSKKIIALVLFVAMMLMMVPAANAAVGTYDDNVVGFELKAEHWFDDYAAEALVPTSATNTYTIGSGGVTMKISSAAFLSTFNYDATPSANTSYDKAGSTGSAVTIDLSGKLADLTAYYYTQLGTMVPKAKAVKIPYRVTNVSDSYAAVGTTLGGEKDQYRYIDQTYRATVNGVPSSQDILVNSTGGYLYYLTVLLTEEDSSQTFDIALGGVTVTKVTVNWRNTASSSSSTNYIAINPVSKSGDQKNNFAVQSVAPKSSTNGILYFDIAKRTSDDNTTIGSIAGIGTLPPILTYFDTDTATGASGYYKIDDTTRVATEWVTGVTEIADYIYKVKAGRSISEYNTALAAYNTSVTENKAALENAKNSMIVKVQAVNSDGTIKPFNTTITASATAIANSGVGMSDLGQDVFLKGTERYAAVGGIATYFLDSDGCFTINVFGIRSWNAFPSSTSLLYLTKAYTATFTFKSGTAAAETAVYDIVFRNVERTTSGITVLDSEVILEVGETYTMQFVVDNANALEKAVEWKTVNKNIVKVDTASTGKITAVALGDTLLYVEDKAGVSHVVRVYVVEDKNGATDPEPVDPGGEPTTGDLYAVTASSLNVRKGPGTSYAKVGSLKRGAEVVVIEMIKDGAWMQIEAVSGFKAADAYYVSGKYLSLVD